MQAVHAHECVVIYMSKVCGGDVSISHLSLAGILYIIISCILHPSYNVCISLRTMDNALYTHVSG